MDKLMNNYKKKDMKRFILFFIIYSIINSVNSQTISAELHLGGMYGSSATSDLTTTLTASSQYPQFSTSSPTIFVYRILQTQWDASNITSVSVVDDSEDGNENKNFGKRTYQRSYYKS